MPNDCAIQPLDVSSFPSLDDISNPGFTELFNELVGDAGTAADGYDNDIATANELLDAIDSGLAGLGGADGGTLDDTFEEILTVDPQPIADLQAQHAAAIPAGDQAEQDLTNLIAGVSSGAPGGGGSGGAGGCDSIDFGSVPTSTASGSASYEAKWPVQNSTQRVVTVKGPTFDPPAAYHFMTSPNPGGLKIQPGETLVVTILFTPGYPGSYSTTLTLLTDAPDPQPCVNLKGVGTGHSLSGGPIPRS